MGTRIVQLAFLVYTVSAWAGFIYGGARWWRTRQVGQLLAAIAFFVGAALLASEPLEIIKSINNTGLSEQIRLALANVFYPRTKFSLGPYFVITVLPWAAFPEGLRAAWRRLMDRRGLSLRPKAGRL